MKQDGELFYIGQVSLVSLRNFILNKNLSGQHVIRLHSRDFDTIVLDYRQQHGQSLKQPFYIFDTLIEEETMMQVPQGRIRALETSSQ